MGVFDDWGRINPNLVYPHCQAKGQVHTKLVKLEKSISGGKAVGALFTGGLSHLATGLRKELTMWAHCNACGSAWDF